MSSEVCSTMILSIASGTYKTASFENVVSLIETRCSIILINWMNLKILIRINRSNSMLPHVTNYVIEISSLEHVNRVGRHPVLHIDIANRLIFPAWQISLQYLSQCIVFIFSRKPDVFFSLDAFPFAKSSSLKIIDLSRPIPRHIYFFSHSSELIFAIFQSPKHRHRRLHRSYPLFALLSPIGLCFVPVIFDKLIEFSIRN